MRKKERDREMYIFYIYREGEQWMEREEREQWMEREERERERRVETANFILLLSSKKTLTFDLNFWDQFPLHHC